MWHILESLNDVFLSLINVVPATPFTLNVEPEILNKLTKELIIPARNLRLRNVIGQGKMKPGYKWKVFR